MATQNLKFIKTAVAQTASAGNKGTIWFDPTNKVIKVSTGTAWEVYYGLADASYDSDKKILTITKPNGTTMTMDLSDMASAAALTSLTTRVSDLEGKHAAGKTVAQEAASAASAAVSGIGTSSAKNEAGSDVVVTVSANSGKVTSVAVDASVLAKKITDEASARATGDSTTLSSAKSYTDEEVKKVKESVASVYKVKGSCLYADLAKKTDAAVGDVWNVTDAHGDVPAGTNYVWTGEDWDALGGTIDLSPYAKIADLKKDDSAVANQVVSAVSESNGIITVSRRALVAADIPTLATSKISGLDNALAGKALKTTTVNGKALSADVVLDGSDVDLSANYATATTYAAPAAGDSLDAAIGKLAKGVSDAKASGVTSFGGKTGAITLNGAGSGDYKVALAMTNNQLGATISGLGTAAAKAASDFDAVGAAAAVLGNKTTDTATSETVYGAIKKAEAAASAATAASNKVDTAIAALDATVDNSATATAAGTANSKQIKVSIAETNGKLTSVSVVAPSFEAAGAASAAVAALDVTGNTSAAVKGVTVTVNETDGKVQKPVVAIADGTVGGSADANLVTGSVVKTYVDNTVANNTSMMWAEFA